MSKRTKAPAPVTTLADVSAAPVELEILGRTIFVHPLRLRDWGYLDRYLREEIVRAARAASGDAAPAEYAAIMKAAFQAVKGVAFDSEEGAAGMLASIGGMLRVVWLSLRQSDNEWLAGNSKAGVEMVDVEEFLGSNLAVLAQVAVKAIGLSFPQELSDEDGDKKKKAGAEPGEST